MPCTVTRFFTFALILTLASSCNSDGNPEEKTQITSMDSTSKVLQENKEKLEEQTKKVEESVEKLDKEFDSTNNSN